MGKHNKTKKGKTSNASLGKALANNLNKKSTKKKYISELHQAEDRVETKINLKSVLEQDSLSEFADLVALSQKQIEVQKKLVLVQSPDAPSNPELAMYNKVVEDQGVNQPKYAALKLPRKPEWNKNMTKEQLITSENKAFLEWRRDIAAMEEGNVSLAITPFEKNLAVWKQLWNVVEKCQLLIQIVDCRNPFFFYSADLERYIKELDQNKHYLLLLNKADYLDEAQISHWNEYFKEKGVEHVFFSALQERTKLEKQVEQEDTSEKKPDLGIKNELLDDIKDQINHDESQERETEVVNKLAEEEQISLLDNTKIYTKEELMRLIRVFVRQKCGEPQGKDHRYNVGMVGYPNVGKSSVINVLCGEKRVAVGARPGKTKHFQTLYLGSDIILCDCPGLVFPSFASSKSEMVCCGVIPIDNLSDYQSPMQLVAKRIPKEMFEEVYKFELPEEFTASELLQIYSAYKGYVTGRGLPDQIKAARTMLKDYNSGKLLFVHLRPDYDPEKHGKVNQTNIENVLNVNETVTYKYDNAEFEESKEESKVEINDHSSNIDSVALTSTKTEDSIPITSKQKKEQEFDKGFFVQTEKKKLNKTQKRALKFAAKRGQNPDEVDLNDPNLLNPKRKRMVGGYDNHDYKKGNHSNKITHFTNLELD